VPSSLGIQTDRCKWHPHWKGKSKTVFIVVDTFFCIENLVEFTKRKKAVRSSKLNKVLEYKKRIQKTVYIPAMNSWKLKFKKYNLQEHQKYEIIRT
jgi:hypothetical protein